MGQKERNRGGPREGLVVLEGKGMGFYLVEKLVPRTVKSRDAREDQRKSQASSFHIEYYKATRRF